jgi:hypothetical protein
MNIEVVMFDFMNKFMTISFLIRIVNSIFGLLLFAAVFYFIATMCRIATQHEFAFSYEGIKLFYDELRECQIYLFAVVPLAALIVAMRKLEIAQQSKVVGIVQKLYAETTIYIEAFNCSDIGKKCLNLILLKIKQKKVIYDVFYNYPDYRINNTEKLKQIFEKFINSEIGLFEQEICKHYYGTSLVKFKDETTVHSWRCFSVVIDRLFLELDIYNDFKDDLKKIYMAAVSEFIRDHADCYTKDFDTKDALKLTPPITRHPCDSDSVV